VLVQANAMRIPLADESVDLIFTDPPYAEPELYAVLAKESMRILKDGKFLVAMCGGYWLDQIYESFRDAGLSYFWEFTALNNARTGSFVHARKVLAQAKALLCFSKGKGIPRTPVMSVFDTFKDKEFHHWGQQTAYARYYIDCLSNPGDLVVDPFCGAGNAIVAASLIGRNVIGFDTDEMACRTAANRLYGLPHMLPLFALPASGKEDHG